MSKINIKFNSTDYSVDESALASATSELKSHLSSVMNGSGATISLDGVTYNIDSAKLSTARNAFVTHLGTIAGSGHKVVVDGVEYNVGSAKVASAVSELATVLGNLHSDDGSSVDCPIVFGGRYSFEFINEYNVNCKTTYIFYENGSSETIYVESGEIVQSYTMPAGSVSYDGLNIVDNEENEILATVSPDGKTFTMSALETTFTLEESAECPIVFGANYSYSFYDGGILCKVTYVFNENGSGSVTGMIVETGDVIINETMPEGTYTYNGTDISATLDGETMTGEVSSDGQTVIIYDENGDPSMEFTLESGSSSPFAFGVKYSYPQGGQKCSFVINEDGSGATYLDDVLQDEFPAGFVTYSGNEFTLGSLGTGEISIDGKLFSLVLNGYPFYAIKESTVSASPLMFGWDYAWSTASGDYLVQWFEDGSYTSNVPEGNGEFECLGAGTFSYDKQKILMYNEGNYVLYGMVSDDGSYITFGSKIMQLSNSHIGSSGSDTLTWDGDTTGLVVDTGWGMWYAVSDAMPTESDLANGVTLTYVDNGVEKTITPVFHDTNNDVSVGLTDPDESSGMYGNALVLIYYDLIEGTPVTGTYFVNGQRVGTNTYVKSITINGYDGF